MFILVIIFLQSAIAQQLDIQIGETKRSFELQFLRQKIKTHQITNIDPVYKSKKTFGGFALTQIIELVGPIPTDLDEVSFVAQDGYSPSLPLRELLSHKGYITFQDNKNRIGFGSIKVGEKTIMLAPFYLVWQDDAKVPEHFPRPYQLVKIQFGRATDKFKSIYPDQIKTNPRAQNGFNHFRQLCFRCHSINGNGGTLAPELNSPHSVMEYWEPRLLKKFILDPPAFRAHTQMPKLEGLTEVSVDEILTYLNLMKDFKNAP